MLDLLARLNFSYLNSILQYLYAIKPLRVAVVTFDKSDAADETQEVQRSRRCECCTQLC